MSSSKKKLIWGSIAVLAIAGIVWANFARESGDTVEVEWQKIAERELKAVVSASGKIRPKTSVDVSAATNGKIVRIAVDEGELVKKGDFLMQIDPTPAEATVRQLEASIEAAKSNHELAQANLDQAKQDLERQEALFQKQLTAEELVQKARTSYNVQILQAQSSKQEITRLQAMLRNANYELEKVSVHADIAGIVTKRNIEEGENVFVGAFNNPATILLTIADLSVIEAVIEVDETDVVDVVVGQEAAVKVDAYPDTSFKATVTKVGHSPIISSSGGLQQQQATSFEVVLQLIDMIPNVRPGLSCKADITTGYREKAIAVPIQALTLKKPSELKPVEKRRRNRKATNSDADESPEKEKEMQGVYVIVDGKVEFRQVNTGIAGDRFFEVLSGLQAEDEVVTGPFREMRRMRNEDAVKKSKKSEEKT
ncbi:MAG: efflux RND transporter periplasmic adaptor subunit [bacterium]